MNEVEQNYEGDVMAVPYQDNGTFKVIIFNNKGEKLADLNLNEEFGIDTKTKPITGLLHPMVTCCFINDDNIFISVMHRYYKKVYSYIYSYKENTKLQEFQMTELENCSVMNYSLKSFWNSTK